MYSTYLGGSFYEFGYAIAADRAGDAYVTGLTRSADFPITADAIQKVINYPGPSAAFVTKFNSDGSEIIFSTYLGARSGSYGLGIGVDDAGSIYASGFAGYSGLPTTPLALKRYSPGYDAFIAKIAFHSFLSTSLQRLGFARWLVTSSSSSKELTITNQSAGSINLRKIYITGLNSGDFAQTNNCPTTFTSASSCAVRVVFQPTTKGTRNGLLAISSSDPASSKAVTLRGVGTFLSLSSATLWFGMQQVGSTSIAKTLTLTNVGSQPLNFTSLEMTGANPSDFSQSNTCGSQIGGGASCTVTVRFSPSAKAARKAAVTIVSDGGGSPHQVTVSGTGT